MHRTAQDNSKLDVSWRLYLRQSGSEVSGAILKTSGDTGTLTGQWKDGKLVMSHFAGERPLLFEAQLNPDGTLNITLDHQFTYRAARSTEARAVGIAEPPDPTLFTSVKDPSEPFHFSGPDLDGKMVSDSDPLFQGKVVVLTIGGSWCPNCHDEAPFLEALYKEFHARGLEVVGLNFELDPDLAQARPRVNSFIKRYGIQFPMLVPGTPDEVPAKLPQLVNFGVYPTTIFVGRDGRVRRVHAGFRQHRHRAWNIRAFCAMSVNWSSNSLRRSRKRNWRKRPPGCNTRVHLHGAHFQAAIRSNHVCLGPRIYLFFRDACAAWRRSILFGDPRQGQPYR